MKGLSKILVVVAVLCALGYAFHRFQSCQIIGAGPGNTAIASTPASTQAVQPAVTPSQADQILVYPNQAALASMKLGYEVLHTNSDGSIMVLPLPPGAALQTTLMLSSIGHHHLSVAGADDKCAAGIDVGVYRLDREDPIYTGTISPVPKKARLMVDLAKSNLSDPFIVIVKLAQGAKNNWFCNVVLSWDSTK